MTEEDCPNKCQGLIVGVRKDPVTRLYKVLTSVLRVYVYNQTMVFAINLNIKTFVLMRISVLISGLCKDHED